MAKHRLLVIDDDPDICNVLKAVFSPQYEVVIAHDGYSGLQRMQAFEPDLIILDIKMPKVDGHQLCDAAKHSKTSKSIPIVFITAHGSEEDEMEAFQQGADLYIRKPFDINDVQNQINRLLYQIVPREKTLSYQDIMNLE